MMKLIMLWRYVLAILLLFCADVHAKKHNNVKPNSNKKPYVYKDAKKLARFELKTQFDLEHNTWSQGKTKIQEGVPLYVEGEYVQPAFYEFSVETEGKDDGAILVNVDKTELVVPEVWIGGRPLFKMYQDLVKLDDVLLVRHNTYRSLAVRKPGDNPPCPDPPEPCPDPTTEVLAYAGFDGGDPVPKLLTEDNFMNATETENIRLEAQEKRKAMLEERTVEEQNAFEYYYEVVDKQLADTVDEGEDDTGGLLRRRDRELKQYPLFDYESKATLGHSLWQIDPESGFWQRWYLPQFRQTSRKRTMTYCWPWFPYTCINYDIWEPVGCTNVAFAMVFAYWDRFHAKWNLFQGTPDWNNDTCCALGTEADRVMWRLNDLLHTNSGGGTSHNNYWKANVYIQERGYLGTVDYDAADSYSKVEMDIRADKPVILSIDTDRDGKTDHAVGVMATFSRYRKWVDLSISSTGSTVLEQAYYTNWGWRNTSQKWILVAGYSSIPDSTYHVTSAAWHVNIA